MPLTIAEVKKALSFIWGKDRGFWKLTVGSRTISARLEATVFQLFGWGPLLLGWRPWLLGWRRFGWRPLLFRLEALAN